MGRKAAFRLFRRRQGKKDAAEAERNRILVEAHTQAAATIEQGHKVVENERQRAMTDLSRSVVDLSVDIAGKIIGSDLDEAEHRALAERLLDEIFANFCVGK